MTVQPNVSLRDDYSQQKPRYLCNTQQINDKRCEICDHGWDATKIITAQLHGWHPNSQIIELF